MTRSSGAGKRTSAAPEVELLSVSPHGIWISVRSLEYLLSYGDYPWFRDARIGDIFDVQLLHGAHLRWPALDVDLHVDSLAHPERFPLKAKVPKRARTAAGRR